MEIKATLQKPYSKEQRIDFIVEQNHQNGYEIKETETSLEAWGLTAEETAQKEKEAQIAILKAQLGALDEKSIRSVRAKIAGTATPEDELFLAQLEEQAENLRQQFQDLQGE